MKHLPTIAGAALGLLFAAFSLMFLLGLVPEQPPPPEGSPVAMFMGAFATTGYLTFVKVLELVGGLLVALPRTRNLGLLVLGPILVNILAFHAFVAREVPTDPVLPTLCVLAVYLLWTERGAWAGLLRSGSRGSSGASPAG